MRKEKSVIITQTPFSAAQAIQAEHLLYWLLCYPLSSVVQLTLFLGMDASRVYQLLTRLEKQKFIEWVTSASQGTHTCRLYHLSQEGLSLLTQLSPHESAVMLAQRWGAREQDLLHLFPRLPHMLLVETFLRGLVTFAPAIHTHVGQRTRVNWHWQRDYTHHFLYHQREQLCRADACVIWRARPQEESTQGPEIGEERWFGAFILVDAGLIPQSLMRERVTTFLHYRESSERWSSSYRSFPTLMILTTTWQRAELWQRAHLAAQDRMGVVDPLFAVITITSQLSAPPGAAPINPWLQVAWKTLATGERCTLEQALVSLDHRALPADLLAHLHRVQALQHLRPSSQLSPFLQKIASLDEPAREPRILSGSFMARAREFVFQKTASTPTEALAYFGLVFGRRYLDILKLLYQAPLLTCEEMAHLIDLQPLSILRYARELQRFNCLQSRPERTSREIRWFVSEQGLRFLAASHHLHVLRLSTTTPSAQQSHDQAQKTKMTHVLIPKGLQLAIHQIKHVKGVYHFLVLFHQQLRAENGHMAWWVPATACERSFHQSGQFYHLRPDAEFQFTLSDGHPSRCWLEWDTGTMQQTGLTRKLQAYARYARSREWAREHVMNLPLLLFVVPDKAQEDKVSRILREECQNTGLGARTTTRSRLDRAAGPLAAIWHNPFVEEAHERSTLLPSVSVQLSGYK